MDTCITLTITRHNHLVYNKILCTNTDDALFTIRKTFKRSQLKLVFVFEDQTYKILSSCSYKKYKVNVLPYVIICYDNNEIVLSFENEECNEEEVKILANGLKNFFIFDCVAVINKNNDEIIEVIE